MNWTSFLIAAFAFAWLVACEPVQSEPRPASTLFALPWNSGLDRNEPAFQVQAIDPATFAIRQSINATFEAPFVYLILGTDKALLVDTGVEGGNLRLEVDRLIDAWRSANKGKAISLVVMHTHGHSDHVGGDAAFTGRADTVVIGHSPEDVAAFFGIRAWPTQTVALDLGGRVVDIVPTPGHHPSHVMVFDRATRVLLSGDAVYPGRLYFQCGKAGEFLESLNRVATFASTRDVRWLLGGHIEMKTAPGQSFQAEDRARRDERLLELPGSIIPKIQQALSKMGGRPRVEAHDEFILFPHPADPRGKSPPDWCLSPQ